MALRSVKVTFHPQRFNADIAQLQTFRAIPLALRSVQVIVTRTMFILNITTFRQMHFIQICILSTSLPSLSSSSSNHHSGSQYSTITSPLYINPVTNIFQQQTCKIYLYTWTQIQAEDELVKYVVKRKGWGSHQTVLRPFSHHPSYSLSKRLPLWWTKDKRGAQRFMARHIHPGIASPISC